MPRIENQNSEICICELKYSKSNCLAASLLSLHQSLQEIPKYSQIQCSILVHLSKYKSVRQHFKAVFDSKLIFIDTRKSV